MMILSRKIKDLRGRRFGRLVIPATAEPQVRNFSQAYWPVVCDCGTYKMVRGSKLTAGRIVSCGCWRAEPAVRSAARLQMPAERRHELARIARMARKH